jgi:hypothetical protein
MTTPVESDFTKDAVKDVNPLPEKDKGGNEDPKNPPNKDVIKTDSMKIPEKIDKRKLRLQRREERNKQREKPAEKPVNDY